MCQKYNITMLYSIFYNARWLSQLGVGFLMVWFWLQIICDSASQFFTSIAYSMIVSAFINNKHLSYIWMQLIK